MEGRGRDSRGSSEGGRIGVLHGKRHEEQPAVERQVMVTKSHATHP